MIALFVVVLLCVGLSLITVALTQQPKSTASTDQKAPAQPATGGQPNALATVTPIPKWWEVKGADGIQKDINMYVGTLQTVKPQEIDGTIGINPDLAFYFTRAYLVREQEMGVLENIPLQLTHYAPNDNLQLWHIWNYDVKGLTPANYHIVVELQAFGTTLVKNGEWFSIP